MTVELDEYFTRIAWDGDRTPTLATLRSLHRAHVLGIPFENLDVVVAEVPSLDLRDLQAEPVESSCGGYRFEHNSLFAAVLERLGFAVRRLTGHGPATGPGPGPVGAAAPSAPLAPGPRRRARSTARRIRHPGAP
ncbi:arylamine N-acetyltransferase [Kitasatospora sp. NPDC088783]|uniref:arylamine N-acetyltransferase n=1 Tax=Kitasatospora sp. NPDC088783 TaxID=3364077 RepID=UPI0038061288